MAHRNGSICFLELYLKLRELLIMEDTITQAIWDAFCVATFVITFFCAIVITTVNVFRKGW